MTTPIAIFLCDESGVMAEPWAAAGIECFCVDVEHSIRKDRKVGLINFVWGDCRSWTPPLQPEDSLRRGLPAMYPHGKQRRARFCQETGGALA